MKKSYVIVIVLILLAIVVFFVFKNKQAAAPTLQNDNAETNPALDGSGTSAPLESTAPGSQNSSTPASIKEFTVTGANFSFSPSTITVKKGDTVKINFKDIGGNHNFVLDEFGVTMPFLKGGEEKTVEFVADKTGSFQYYCSFGTHRAMGMVGTLIVQ